MSTSTATHLWTAFLGVWQRLLVLFGVCWCCLVSVGVCCCPEVCRDTWRRCLRAFEWSVSMFVGFECVYGCIGVLRPWMVQQMLFIRKAPNGKITHTWKFWNIKIAKPSHISSLKIMELSHFLPDFTRDQNLLLRVKTVSLQNFHKKLLKMGCNKNVCCTCTILRNYISLARTETSILPYYRTKIISFKACSF